jgi:DNA-binding transcriptional LysR family regulator
MTVFLKVADSGSMTAAADALGTSPPSVVRSIAALEAELGVRLIHRTTRRMALTDEGREYRDHCRRVLAEVEAGEAALSARRFEPKGKLRLTAPVMFGRLHVGLCVSEFIEKHPAVEVELLLLDRVIDLVEEGVDAAVRIGEMPDSPLVATKIGQTRRTVCAAPGLVKAVGAPKAPEELARLPAIAFTGLSGNDEWRFAGDRRIGVKPALRTNQVDVALDACLRGLGFAQLFCYQVEAPLRAKRLVRVLDRFEPEPSPIQIVYPQQRHLSANVRAFVDFAAKRLRRRLRAVA